MAYSRILILEFNHMKHWGSSRRYPDALSKELNPLAKPLDLILCIVNWGLSRNLPAGVELGGQQVTRRTLPDPVNISFHQRICAPFSLESQVCRTWWTPRKSDPDFLLLPLTENHSLHCTNLGQAKSLYTHRDATLRETMQTLLAEKASFKAIAPKKPQRQQHREFHHLSCDRSNSLICWQGLHEARRIKQVLKVTSTNSHSP